jgi:hypothetical protein
MSQDCVGQCLTCYKEFSYQLLHNGFGNSAYAYCDRCGCLASLSAWFNGTTPNVRIKYQGPINLEAESYLAPCSCGGAFRASASPRCPHCVAPIDAVAAASYIERNAPGTKGGWQWQRSWDGIYSLMVEGRIVNNNWVSQ